MVLILSRAEVEQLLSMEACIKVVENAFIEYSNGAAVVPIRNAVQVSKHNGIALYMPALLPKQQSLACKIVTIYPENPVNHKLPTILSTVFLQDPRTGEVVAIMDGTYLTAVRTGAASGVAIKYLAKPDASTVGIIGAGMQARTQLWAASVVRNLECCKIYDVNRNAVRTFIDEMSAKIDLQIDPATNTQDAVTGSDIIMTATTSPTPVFQGAWVKPGTCITAIGSFTPQTRELDTHLIQNAKVVVDSIEACMEEAGDLIIPIHEGAITQDHIYAELGDIASGNKPGREHSTETTIFKSVGLAVQDAAAAKLVYNTAKTKGLGTELTM